MLLLRSLQLAVLKRVSVHNANPFWSLRADNFSTSSAKLPKRTSPPPKKEASLKKKAKRELNEEEAALLPRVVLVGRPNVGKSALYNRLVRRKEALVYDTPGGHVTRDYREGVAKLADLRFKLFDTAGMETNAESGSLLGRAKGLTAGLLARSHIALFMVDARAGVQPMDIELARWLRRSSSLPVIVAANKCEGGHRQADYVLAAIGEAYQVGFGEAVAISAESGEGLADLYEKMQPHIDKAASNILAEEEARRQKRVRALIQTSSQVPQSSNASGLSGESKRMIDHTEGIPDDEATRVQLGNCSESFTRVDEPALDTESAIEIESFTSRQAVERTAQHIDEIVTASKIAEDTEEKEAKVVEADALAADGNENESCSLRDKEAALSSSTSLLVEKGHSPWKKENKDELDADIEQHLDISEAEANEHKVEEVNLEDDDQGAPLQFAIAGRPNVGKSTLVNYLLGQDRVLTGPEPGLTRDSVRIPFEHGGRPIWLVDTAGWMHRSRLEEGGPQLSAADARKSIMRAHVVALMLDAEEIVASGALMKGNEITLASWVLQEGRVLIVLVNKIDSLNGAEQRKLTKNLSDKLDELLPQARGAPILTLSALKGFGVDKLMPKVVSVYESWRTRLPTSRLNRWLQKVELQMPNKAGYGVRARYMTQIKARPPTFVVFVSGVGDFPDSRLRFFASGIRKEFGLDGVPVRILERRVKRNKTGKVGRRKH